MPEHSDGHFQTILSDPAAFPQALDFTSGEMVFLSTSRKILSQSSFLDGRTPLAVKPYREVRLGLTEILDFQEKRNGFQNPGRWNFIFHSGFCCSSLLARCLDREGVCLALKEPNILNNLSEARRLDYPLSRSPDRWQKTLINIFDLLFRRFSETEQILLKPSNVDNVLIPEILTAKAKSRIVFLYSDLKSFLISVAKGGKPRREFVRRLLAKLKTGLDMRGITDTPMLSISDQALWRLSDLHLAAATWHLQMEAFKNVRARFPEATIKMLDCEDFVTDPQGTIKDLNNFFGLEGNGRDLQATLTRHAKAPEFTYSPTMRRTEYHIIENYLGDTLVAVLDWAENNLFADPRLSLPKIAI